METNTKKIDEISIPVPWGHVAGNIAFKVFLITFYLH